MEAARKNPGHIASVPAVEAPLARDRIVLVQTSIGDYRQPVLDLLAERLGLALLVLAGPRYFDPSLVTRVVLPNHLRLVENRFFFRRRFLWQSGVIVPAIRAEYAILELNPRIVSVWLILLVRKALRRPSALWGHAWPRRGERAATDHVRQWMRSLASTIVVYTESQAEELRSRMPGKAIVAAPNAVYRRSQIEAVDRRGASSFVFVGRLVAPKKPDLLLEAFRIARSDLGGDARLVFVGDGPLRTALESTAADLGDAVAFLGHIGDHAVLRSIYAGAIASVSPGYVGLSATQSFSFGVPMLIADDEPHAPEIEAAVLDMNARFFEAGSVNALAAELVRMWQERERWNAVGHNIANDCADRYSVELMAARLIEAILGTAKS